jgi:hypothetical protein
MKIFKFCAAIAMTAALMTAQPLFGATGHAAGFSDPNIAVAPAPETGSTFALLFLSFFALMGVSLLASFRQRKRKVV